MNEPVLRNHSFPLVFCLWTSGALAVLKNESLKTLLLILKMVLFFQFSLWCGVKSRKYSKKQRSSPSFKRSAPRLHSDAWTGMRPCITTVSQRLWRWGNVVPLFEEAYCMTHVRNRAACALFLHSGSTLYTLVFFMITLSMNVLKIFPIHGFQKMLCSRINISVLSNFHYVFVVFCIYSSVPWTKN